MIALLVVLCPINIYNYWKISGKAIYNLFLQENNIDHLIKTITEILKNKISTYCSEVILHDSYFDNLGKSSISKGVFLYMVEFSHENVTNENNPALSTGDGTFLLKSIYTLKYRTLLVLAK